MPSFLSFLLFAGVWVSVSAELIPESTDPCRLKTDLTVSVIYPVDALAKKVKDNAPVPQCGIHRDLKDVGGLKAPEVSMHKQNKLEDLIAMDKDLLAMGEDHFDEEAFFFTLVMVDPDAPMVDPDALAMVDPGALMADLDALTEGGKPGYYLHWLIVDNEGDDFTNGLGMEIKSYTPPNPPAGSGLHRYQFFAYRQPNGTITDSMSGVPDGTRSDFDLQNFQTKNNLGAPTAGYEFLTENKEKKRKDPK